MKLGLFKITVIQLAIICGAAVVGLFLYAAYSEKHAEQKAKDFCASVSVGSSSDGLIQKATNLGAEPRMNHWSRVTDEKAMLPVTFIGFTPFSRHICNIEASRSAVLTVGYNYLD